MPSWCGEVAWVHERPSSLENARRTSYAYGLAALTLSQCAASDPSASRTTDGTSAQFTNQSRPAATLRASDHPVGVRSATLSVASALMISIQLRSSLSPSTLNCGCALPFAAAGEPIG